MSHRTSTFGVDRPQFERILDAPLRDHLLAFTDGRQDLEGGHSLPRRFAEFCDSSGEDQTLFIDAKFKVRRKFQGEFRVVSREQLGDMPELAVPTRDYIQASSALDYRFLMELLAEFEPYPFVRGLVGGVKRWWIERLLATFAYWYGPESTDTKAVQELFARFSGHYLSGAANQGFPPVPRENGEVLWMAAWTTDETRFALLNLRTLLEYGGEPPHRETQRTEIGHKRYMLWDRLSQPTPEENEEWNILLQIVHRFLALDEYAEPAVINFIDV